MKKYVAYNLKPTTRKNVIAWYQKHADKYTDGGALQFLAEILTHHRFGDDGFAVELGSFESKNNQPNTYTLYADDYSYELVEE